MISTLHIVVAMKPLDGNFVQNALRYGVAGINIDGCRIGTDDILTGSGSPPLKHGGQNHRPFHDTAKPLGINQSPFGRWSANVILEGGSVKAMDEQSGDTSSTRSSGNMNNPKRGGNSQPAWGMSDGRDTIDYRDSGGASRFFKQVREI